MISRYPNTIAVSAVALLVLGLTLGVGGLLGGSVIAAHIGILTSIASLPAVAAVAAARAVRISERRLAETHDAGYKLALHHVAMGLLDDGAGPTPGTPHTQWAENVILFPLKNKNEGERKAQ